MKTKLFSLLSLSVLMLVMFMSLASAATYIETFDNSNATGIYGDNSFLGDNGVTWTFDNSKDAETYFINDVSLQFEDSTSKITSDTISGGISNFSVNLAKATTSSGNRQVELFINDVSKGTSEVFDDTDTHTFTVENINIEGSIVIEIRNILDTQIVVDDITWIDYTAPVEEPEEPEELTACSTTGNPDGDLIVEIDDIKVINGFGDDEEWLPLDEIEVEIVIENDNDDYDIDDIEVMWGLYNSDTGKWYIDDEENDFNLKDNEEETITLKFKLDDDVDELEDGDYTFYVWANGNLDDDSDDGVDLCASDSKDIDMIIESDFVILTNIELNGQQLEDGLLFSEPFSCASNIQITADVWNIGDSDQDDVYVMIHNNELGINEKIEIGDIDAFEDEKLTFEFQVPQDAEEKWYDLWFTVYDEDNDVYENDYDEENSEFSVSLKVEGNCIIEPQVMVTATLESGGNAGEELVIRATVTNTGNNLVTYTLNPEGYNEWATLASVEPSTIILEAGNSKDVLITFNVNQDASGDKLFNIEVLSGDESVIKQSVSITIEKQGFNFPGITGNLISEGNWYLWGIGALNVILIIVIILVALKVAKKKE